MEVEEQIVDAGKGAIQKQKNGQIDKGKAVVEKKQ